jgi:hypothetical protein
MVLRDFDVLAGAGAPPRLWPPAPVTPLRPRPPEPAPAHQPELHGLLSLETRRGRVFQRLLEIAPGAVSWFIVSALFWGALLVPGPLAAAVAAFDLLWLYLSVTTAWFALMTFRRMRRDHNTDWRREHDIAFLEGRAIVAWEEVFHVVVIPSYKEPLEILRRAMESIAAQANAQQIIVVLAMEAREQNAGQKALALESEFRHRLGGVFSTYHPAGLPGEIVGKSSNENWAARIAKRHLVDELGYDLHNLTITSCDADTVFHPQYFSCLSYKFATNPDRHRRFWQSPVLLTNNIWHTPAPVRVGSMLADVHIMGNLSKTDRIVFPQSTYSLSLQMADDAGYWDPDVIAEDWHMFLKCFYLFSGKVEVEPIYLHTGNDAVRSRSVWCTFVENYRQKKRHAWGASDIPYAVRQALAHTEMGRWRRARRVFALSANHLLWTTNWFLLTVGWWAPATLRGALGIEADVGLAHEIGRISLTICLIPYVIAIVLDSLMRPPKPQGWKPWQSLLSALSWFALPVTSFVFSTLPALESQTRLMLGKRLEYRVTDKV